ncbi:IucA/IucC family protein [Halosolutus halophilus]|uniref:IucA/IucC family protein n=1 Tax=Halosolutus halophilus TaxID=1552990 RepID=UPI0022351BCA|nr:IucA/IucC family protein [Halosolutus halophilus]
MTDVTGPVDVQLRTAAERDAFAVATRYADANDLANPPETAYLSVLPTARSIATRRLLRGLVRGSPDALPDPETCRPTAATTIARRMVPTLDDANWTDGSLQVPDGCDRVALLPFPEPATVVCAPIEGEYGYGRLRLAEPIRRLAVAGIVDLDHPLDLAALLRRSEAFRDVEQAARIERELAESTANLALARVARCDHRRSFGSAGTILGPGSDPEDVTRRLRAADAPAALERLVTDGHPLHPSAKIRRGMAGTAGLAYAPEFTGSIDVRFVAVHTERVRETSIDDRSLTDRLYTAFDGLADAVSRTVPTDAGEYAVIPVHPWQFQHVLPDRYESQRADGTVVPIPDFVRSATPLLNLRTVVPYAAAEDSAPTAPLHCKLAIGVQLTNVERTVSPQAVHNGPRVTRLLREIADSAAFSGLGFLSEPAATCYYPPGGPHVDGDSYDDVRHLSGLVRSNPRSHRLVGTDGRVVPAAVLVADSPATGDPLVREAVDRYADAIDATDLADATRAFVDAYVSAVVTDQLRLLSAYGIALESHLQNSYVVFEDGRPTGTLVRDFGGIRVHEERLAERGLSMEIYPDSDIEADDERDLHWKLFYALFQNHLTELFVALVESTPVDARECWAIVRDHCRSTFEDLRGSGVVSTERVDRDETALFAEPATHKALTTMRLEGKRHEYATSSVSNPIGGRSTSSDRVDRSE